MTLSRGPQPFNDSTVEALLTSRGTAHDPDLAAAFAAVRALGAGPAPAPSVALAAVFSGGLTPAAAQPPRPRNRRRVAGTIAAALALMSGSLVGAATANALPPAAQRVVSAVVQRLTPLHLPDPEPDEPTAPRSPAAPALRPSAAPALRPAPAPTPTRTPAPPRNTPAARPLPQRPPEMVSDDNADSGDSAAVTRAPGRTGGEHGTDRGTKLEHPQPTDRGDGDGGGGSGGGDNASAGPQAPEHPGGEHNTDGQPLAQPAPDAAHSTDPATGAPGDIAAPSENTVDSHGSTSSSEAARNPDDNTTDSAPTP